jgi:hypothetical protein
MTYINHIRSRSCPILAIASVVNFFASSPAPDLMNSWKARVADSWCVTALEELAFVLAVRVMMGSGIAGFIPSRNSLYTCYIALPLEKSVKMLLPVYSVSSGIDRE